MANNSQAYTRPSNTSTQKNPSVLSSYGATSTLEAVAGASTVAVTSTSGADATIPAATESAAGVMTAADKAVLNDSAAALVSLTNKESGAVVIGTPVYSFAAGQIKKARANAAGTGKAIGLVKATSIAADEAGDVQVEGILTATTAQWDVVTGGSGGLTAGSTYYVSAATAGLLTTSAPANPNYITPVGIALSTTQMKILIDLPVAA